MNSKLPSKLGDYISVKHGFAFKSAYFTDVVGTDVLLTPANFAIGGGFQDARRKYYAGPIPDGYVLQAGDLVVTMTDLSRGGDTLGYPALIPDSTDRRYLHNQRIGLVQIHPDAPLDRHYLYYLLRGDDYRHHVLATASGSTVRHTSPSRICDFRAILPSLEKQHAIAGVLGALDEKIEQNRLTAELLERLARAIFRAWFVDFTPVKAKAAGAGSFPSMPQHVFDALPDTVVDSDSGPVPMGWEVADIGDVVTIKGGGTPSTKNPDFWEGGEHCWATPRDLSRLSHPLLFDTERYITDAGIDQISSGLLPVGTVLMSSRAPVGYLAISGVPTAVNQGFIAMICDGPLPPTFVLNWAHSRIETIESRASGTAFPEISKRNFRTIPITVPSGDIVVAYSQSVDPLFELLAACIRETESLVKVRDYLLPPLLNGQVRVEVADG